MTPPNRTLPELHDRIVYLWENKQYGNYSLGTPQNHILKINADDTLDLTHDNAVFEAKFNPLNSTESLRNFLSTYLSVYVFNPQDRLLQELSQNNININ